MNETIAISVSFRWRKYLEKFGGYGVCTSQYCAPQATEDVGCKLELSGKVLEIGSGTGGFLNKYGPQGMVGLDRYTPEFCKENPWARNGDMHDLPFADGVFDTVYSSNVFEHALSPIIALCEANRVLKNEGMFYLVVPKDEPQWVGDTTHISCLSDSLWRKNFGICGFELVKFEEHPNGPMWYYHLKKIKNWDAP